MYSVLETEEDTGAGPRIFEFGVPGAITYVEPKVCAAVKAGFPLTSKTGPLIKLLISPLSSATQIKDLLLHL